MFYAKLLDLPKKFDRIPFVALVKFHAKPRECIEDQDRAVTNIMKCIDVSMKVWLHIHIG